MLSREQMGYQTSDPGGDRFLSPSNGIVPCRMKKVKLN